MSLPLNNISLVVQPPLIPNCKPRPKPCTFKIKILDWFFSTCLIYSAYQVQTQNYNSTNVYQQWYVIQSNFSQYYYIANSTDRYMKVIPSNGSSKTPLFLQPMHSGYLDRYQLWIFLQPGNAVTTANPCFMIMNAITGLVWNVRDYDKSPGTVVQVYPPNPGLNEQFCIFYR